MLDGNLTLALVAFAGATMVLLIVSPRTVHLADDLADLTGLGEAVMGAAVLGAVTSLPDILASVTPALEGAPEQAIGNGLGGITIQTAFLAIADLFHRRSNLEHAAVSVPNMLQSALLVSLLSVLLLATATPEVDFWAVHPATLAMAVMYVYGLRIVSRATDDPMWQPTESPDTVIDVPDEEPPDASLTSLWARFAAMAAVLAATGWLLGHSGVTIARETGLSETAVGALLTAGATSMSELVVSVAAVRQGALTLAVANVIGGNTFDTLIVGIADVSYREGSIYHQATSDHIMIIGIAILLTALLLMGLLRRQRHGVANIGFESAAVLVVYGTGAALLLV